jgi:hypothetical protein
MIERKTFEARERINKLNSHVTPSAGIKPEIAVVRGERLAAMPPMLQFNVVRFTAGPTQRVLK